MARETMTDASETTGDISASWGSLKKLSVTELLSYRARQQPSTIALSAMSWRGHRDRLGYAQLDFLGRKVGASLAALGLGHGDRVAVYLDNDAAREAILISLGCLAIGAMVAPLNTRNSDEELSHALNLIKPALVVVREAARHRVQKVGSFHLMVIDAEKEEEGVLGWPEPTESRVVPACVSSMHHDDLACLLFTSGTSARSKAVMHTHQSMLAAGFAAGNALGFRHGDLYQGAFPFFTSSCLNIACIAPWVHGAGLVLESERLNNAQRFRLIESECVTFYHGVPSIIQFMLDESENGGYQLERVTRVAYGGAAMPTAVIERIRNSWPWMDQIHVWGMTESGPAGAWLPSHWLPEKAGSMGHAMPNCELKVVDERDQPVPPGVLGELCFRGPSMSLGYLNDPEATAQAFRGGWLHSGDLVICDSDGFLYFIDRMKDVINRGGIKISSAAVEAAIYRIPGVREAAVIAVAHPRLGEDIAACVVMSEGSEGDVRHLSQLCREWLTEHEIPRKWVFMNELPKNPLGKILKRELRETLVRQSSTTESQL